MVRWSKVVSERRETKGPASERGASVPTSLAIDELPKSQHRKIKYQTEEANS
jgi:hypothetical protein